MNITKYCKIVRGENVTSAVAWINGISRGGYIVGDEFYTMASGPSVFDLEDVKITKIHGPAVNGIVQ